MKKKLIVVILFFSCSLQSMQKSLSQKTVQKMLLEEVAGHYKEKTKDIKKRAAAKELFIESIDAIVCRNGFNPDEKDLLADNNEQLRNADIEDDESFIAFYELARASTVHLKQIVKTLSQKAKKMYPEQVFVLGTLSVLRGKIEYTHSVEKMLSKKMSEYYSVSPQSKIHVKLPSEKSSPKPLKKVRIKEPTDEPTFLLAEIPKAQFKKILPKDLEEGVE